MIAALLVPLWLAFPAPAPKTGYVKVRVEVEIRGTLKYTDKAVTVRAPSTTYSLSDDKKAVASGDWDWPLDFDRAKDLRELAKALDGKEVVVTGLNELRAVIHMPAPGGATGFTGGHGFGFPMPTPTWKLMDTVLVTGLKSAPAK